MKKRWGWWNNCLVGITWDRWRALQKAAAHFIGNTASPAAVDFPPLLASQQRRILAGA